MINPERSRKHATRVAGLLAVSALAIGVSACGGSSSGSTSPATKTATAKQSAPANTGEQFGGGPGVHQRLGHQRHPGRQRHRRRSAGNVQRDQVRADYNPSTVVSKHGGSIVLSSPDSVTKIGAYYKGVLAKGGWQVQSATVTAASASFSAHRTGEGVTISVYPQGSGSGISITTYPQ